MNDFKEASMNTIRRWAVLLALLAFGHAAFAQDREDAALRALVQRMVEAQQNHDPATLDQVFAADYIEISPIGEFDPRDKVLGFYKPELKPPADKMSVSTVPLDFSIRRDGPTAIVIVRLEATITREGQVLPPRSMRTTLVCRMTKGGWKIASAQYTGIRPPAPSAPASAPKTPG